MMPVATFAQPAATDTPATGGKVQVAAGPRYAAGPIWSFFFGKDYRDLWTTPIEVPVLDLATFAGGLEPTKAGGGRQTRSLQLKGANGREYKFRSIDKDPSDALPEEVRGGQLEDIVQDQTSSGHPAAPLVVERLLRAADLVQVRWRLVVLPDSPRLGQFQKDFAGLLGTLENDPDDDAPQRTPGFEALTRIVESEELYALQRKSAAERIDARAYLRARLVDMYVGDWDRHYRQWEWGKSEDGALWMPIPKDRDQAFSSYDGFFLRFATGPQAPLGVFRKKYGNLARLNWTARELDRRFLPALSAEVWKEEAADLTGRFTDAVIEDAVRRMPPEYYRLDGARLESTLKARRDALPRVARDWFLHLADDVDVFASDEDERLDAVHAPDALEMRLTRKGDARPYFSRRFVAGETEEVRVYLQGGADQAVIQGTGPVKLRVIGGKGDDVLDDGAGGRTRFYDFEGDNAITRGPHTQVGTRPYDEPAVPVKARPRDWGATWSTPLWLTARSDLGLFVGIGVQRVGYGFRREPFSSRQIVRAGYATGAGKSRMEYLGEFRRVQSRSRVEVFARASAIEVVRFFGFGNETVSEGDDLFYRTEHEQYTLLPALNFPVGPVARVRVGPKVRWSSSRVGEDRFLGRIRPYGAGRFGEVGLESSLEWDTRDVPAAPHKGLFVRMGGSFYPPVWSVERAFGEVHGEATAAVTAKAPLETTLAARAGGKTLFGPYPYFEAAFIGGSRRDATVRGLRGQRYAGDSSLYGNVELRVKLAKLKILVPTDVGIFGLTDVGRVFLSGESSGRWHKGMGGGVWLAPVDRRYTVSLAVAHSEGRNAAYAGMGFW